EPSDRLAVIGSMLQDEVAALEESRTRVGSHSRLIFPHETTRGMSCRRFLDTAPRSARDADTDRSGCRGRQDRAARWRRDARVATAMGKSERLFCSPQPREKE